MKIDASTPCEKVLVMKNINLSVVKSDSVFTKDIC